MALHGVGRWLARQRAGILIVFGLALLGGACGWLLRDQFVKREEMRRAIDDEQSLLDRQRMLLRDPPHLLLPRGEPDRLAGGMDRPSVRSRRS